MRNIPLEVNAIISDLSGEQTNIAVFQRVAEVGGATAVVSFPKWFEGNFASTYSGSGDCGVELTVTVNNDRERERLAEVFDVMSRALRVV